MTDLPALSNGTLKPLKTFPADNPVDQFISGQLSEKTKKAYYSDLCQFFGSGKITLEDIQLITFQDLIDYRNELSSQGYKRSTINRKLSSLKAFFKMLVAAGLIENNPADTSLVRGYRQEENLNNKAIPNAALQSIFNMVSEEENELLRARNTALIFLLTYGGLRRSEAAKINWSDIRQEGAFYILDLPETKSGVPQDIKLQAAVIHHLNEYKNKLQDNGYSTEAAVFISLSPNKSHGAPLSDHSINQIVKKIALKAGVNQNITAHMFRHTCCTLAIEGGAKPQQVQAHLRHKDLKTTMHYYENREKLVDNASDYINVK